MSRIAVIGGGISGVSAARILSEKHEPTVFEAQSKPGGLVRCDRIEDNLYHRVGGHVFNAKNPKVHEWFWQFFDRDREFLKAERNAQILIKDRYVGYPIEDHLFQMDATTVERVVEELIQKDEDFAPRNFAEFLQHQFGPTLFSLYFKPYNEKIWKQDLSQISLEWLEGKLPMPEVEHILLHNILRKEESEMVHSQFFYAQSGGSQFIIDRLSEGLDIQINSPVKSFERNEKGEWLIHGQAFDHVVYTGDLRKLQAAIQLYLPELEAVQDLASNGTSSVFCECDPTDISWLYLPDPSIKAHRIIYTGTFSADNNRGSDRITCVVEYSGWVSEEERRQELSRLPGNLKPLDYNYEANSYVIQKPDTAAKVHAARQALKAQDFHILGRFGEWEYYNMDKAIEAAMRISEEIG